MKLKAPALALLALLSSSAPARAGSDMERLARDLGEAARSAGLRRVAVAPFESARGAGDERGAALTETLIVALVSGGRVQAVERGLLGKLADEISLDKTGAVRDGARREVRLSPVDGLVVGRYQSDGRRIKFFARVVDAHTGVIVAAASAEVDEDSMPADVFDVPVPASRGGFPPPDGEQLRDAPAEARCADAVRRVDALQEGVLELKARYWAFRLRLGVAVNPGSTILNGGLRERFYERLRVWRAAERIPPMSREELDRLADAEGRSYGLVRDCGL
jgi:TolB-like protein